MEDIKISIVLATYNGETYLEEQLLSILNQTFQPFEIIVSDDHSTDRTDQILEKFKSSNRIKYYKNSFGRGVIQNFNHALSYVSGEYIAFCDQDDIWVNNKLEKCINQMVILETAFGKQIPILVFSDLELIDEKGNPFYSSLFKYNQCNPLRTTVQQLLLDNPITGNTILINKALNLKAYPIPPQALMHDVWLGLIASQFGKIAYIDEILVKYRIHLTNVAGKKRSNLWNRILSFSNSEFNASYLVQNRITAGLFLRKYKKELESKTITQLEKFENYKSFNKISKILFFIGNGFTRNTISQNLGMFLRI